jgi:hypothetical protein
MDNIGREMTDTVTTLQMSVFQYMIGNADYSIHGRHNVKLVKVKDFEKPNLIPVPYDFDYAGIVNAHYAIPGDNLNINSVTERYFLGPCREEQYYQKTLELFKEKKDAIYKLIEDFDYLETSAKNTLKSYLEEFYNGIESPDYIQRNFNATCL